MFLTINNVGQADEHLAKVHAAAARTRDWIAANCTDAMGLLHALKFRAVGFHPTGDHALNAIEQINQTFAFAVAIAAARELLILHPDVGGFRLAPGAHMSMPLDIMSEQEGLVGAETFAAVTPKNNNKLNKDLDKLAARTELHRYVFFASPQFPGVQRIPKLERDGIQVWSVDV